MLNVLDLFSGIGGFSLGLEKTGGFETVAFCEIDPICRDVLKKHWPDVPIYEDITELNAGKITRSIDVVCGGFPCQDLSVAGRQAGFEGERSSLYRQMLRIISECLPSYAIFENVSGLLAGEQGRWFGQFLYDLAAIGYDAEWHCISASFLGAPHHRDRVWVIAYPGELRARGNIGRKCKAIESERNTKPSRVKVLDNESNAANANVQRCEGISKIAKHLQQQIEFVRSAANEQGRFNLSEPGLCRANDGVSGRAHRLKQLGNSVVPQIPEAIGRAILLANQE